MNDDLKRQFQDPQRFFEQASTTEYWTTHPGRTAVLSLQSFLLVGCYLDKLTSMWFTRTKMNAPPQRVCFSMSLRSCKPICRSEAYFVHLAKGRWFSDRARSNPGDSGSANLNRAGEKELRGFEQSSGNEPRGSLACKPSSIVTTFFRGMDSRLEMMVPNTRRIVAHTS